MAHGNKNNQNQRLTDIQTMVAVAMIFVNKSIQWLTDNFSYIHVLLVIINSQAWFKCLIAHVLPLYKAKLYVTECQITNLCHC